MAERTPPPIPFDPDTATYADIDSALVWWFRTAMDTAADPGRPARSRMSLLRNGCKAWQQITEHRREWRLHDKLVAQLQVLKRSDEGFPKAGA